jgi:hypothetical protein
MNYLSSVADTNQPFSDNSAKEGWIESWNTPLVKGKKPPVTDFSCSKIYLYNHAEPCKGLGMF